MLDNSPVDAIACHFLFFIGCGTLKAAWNLLKHSFDGSLSAPVQVKNNIKLVGQVAEQEKRAWRLHNERHAR